MFDEIAKHEDHKTELPIAIFAYEIAYFFYCFFLIDK